jgi:hypothetical protein
LTEETPVDEQRDGPIGAAKTVTAAATDQARDVAGQAADATKNVAATVRDELSGVAHEATEQGRNLVSETKQQVRSQAQHQTDQLADGLRRLGYQLRALTEGRTDEAGALPDYVNQAALTVDRYARQLSEGGFEGAVRDLERFARRRPGLFLLGGAIAGFGVGRVIRGAKAASDEESTATPRPALAGPQTQLPTPAVTDEVDLRVPTPAGDVGFVDSMVTTPSHPGTP